MPFRKGHRYNRWTARGGDATTRGAGTTRARAHTPTPEADDVEAVQDAEGEPEAEETQTPPRSRRSGVRSTPQNTPRTNRRRRQATQPNYKLPDPHATVDDDEQASVASPPSNDGTPGRGGRARGRGHRSGFRGYRRGRAGRSLPGPAYTTRVPLDDDGNPHEVANDELVLPTDEAGEKKTDIDGYLQDGREYARAVKVFMVQDRGRRLYMLSTEPARYLGYRDSYLFFTKHPLLYKLILTDPEKLDLIDRGFIPHSYKGRTISVVTAHSVYREFGARIVAGGKKVIDDYKETAARERGDVEGELAEASDRNLGPGGGANGAGLIGRPGGPGRRKAQVTTANWMLEHAREASRFNSALAAKRKQQNIDGVYDPQTNLVMWPGIMQPTAARWEVADETRPQSPALKKRRLLNGTSLPNGDTASYTSKDNSSPDFLATPSASITSNFLVVDTILQHPPSAAYPLPGPGHIISDSATLSPSLGARAWQPADMSEKDVMTLDVENDTRHALRRARAEQQDWTNAWSGETLDGMRAAIRVGVKSL
ncbi:MAG: hypothetical protein M1828_001862 [Chrysothrix sp. TS-e1954]|nr:MAG: hypothetical protein M1828_001862 [Chrysothrix sp. TS-e1954]